MTIRRRVRVALFLMMLVPVFFMAGAFGFARRYISGANGLEHARAFLSEFNQLVNENPRALSDPQSLAILDRVFGRDAFGWWEILRGGRVVYTSPGAVNGPQARPRWRWRPGSTPDLSWSFRFQDGSPGTLRVYLGAPWTPPFRSPFGFVGFLAFLFGCNALLGMWVSSSVIGPLSRLRNAAVRIGEGDLRFRLDPGGPDELGQVTGAFETMRQKLEAAVSRQLAEEASRKELIAHVSHDLRTPINLIRGYAEGLRDGVASTPQMRERYLQTILERAGELERLIELLFSYSTMDLEGARPKLAAVEVAPYLQGLRDSLAAAFPAADITLTLPGDAASPGPSSARLFIKADAELTRRVMSNLVENAVKHGGKPRIAIEWRVSLARGPAGAGGASGAGSASGPGGAAGAGGRSRCRERSGQRGGGRAGRRGRGVRGGPAQDLRCLLPRGPRPHAPGRRVGRGPGPCHRAEDHACPGRIRARRGKSHGRP
jgi:signal transduction histidine kinase